MSLNRPSPTHGSETNASEDSENRVYEGVLFGKPRCEIITFEDGSTTVSTVAVSVPMIHDPKASPEVQEQYKWEGSEAQANIYEKWDSTEFDLEQDRNEFEEVMREVKYGAAKGISSTLFRTPETNTLELQESALIDGSAAHFEELEGKHKDHQTDPLFQDMTKVVWFEALDVSSAPGEAMPTS